MQPDDDTPQADEQPADDQPADSDQPTEQPEEQPAESDQPAEQSEEQPAESDQPAEQSEEQPTDSDQPAEQSEEQPTDSDQPATSESTDSTLAFAGGDASAAPGSGGATKVSTRNLKVKATFTQDGKKFFGEILIRVFEDPGRELFPRSGQVWQSTTLSKGNVITTPLFAGVTTTNVAVWPQARMVLDTKRDGTIVYQNIESNFVLPVPSSGTLEVTIDMPTAPINKTVTAPDANAARVKVIQSLAGHWILGTPDVKPLGNQQFVVTGTFLPGAMYLLEP